MIKFTLPKTKLDRVVKLFSFTLIAAMFLWVGALFFSLRASFDGLMKTLASMP